MPASARTTSIVRSETSIVWSRRICSSNISAAVFLAGDLGMIVSLSNATITASLIKVRLL
jgi:hypothetical protein